jgi:hypothetical protein
MFKRGSEKEPTVAGRKEDPSFCEMGETRAGQEFRSGSAWKVGRWQVWAMGAGCWVLDAGCWWTVAGRKNPAPAKKEGAGPRTEKDETKRGEGKGGMDEMGMGMLKWISRHCDNFAGFKAEVYYTVRDIQYSATLSRYHLVLHTAILNNNGIRQSRNKKPSCRRG